MFFFYSIFKVFVLSSIQNKGKITVLFLVPSLTHKQYNGQIFFYLSMYQVKLLKKNNPRCVKLVIDKSYNQMNEINIFFFKKKTTYEQANNHLRTLLKEIKHSERMLDSSNIFESRFTMYTFSD